MSASRTLSATDISRTTFDPSSVGASSEAVCKALASRTFICRLLSTLLRVSRYARPSACALGTARADAKHIRSVLSCLVRFLAFSECEQIGAHLLLVRRAQPMRGALVDLQGCALDEL